MIATNKAGAKTKMAKVRGLGLRAEASPRAKG